MTVFSYVREISPASSRRICVALGGPAGFAASPQAATRGEPSFVPGWVQGGLPDLLGVRPSHRLVRLGDAQRGSEAGQLIGVSYRDIHPRAAGPSAHGIVPDSRQDLDVTNQLTSGTISVEDSRRWHSRECSPVFA